MANKVIFASAALVLLALIPLGDAECCGYWHSFAGSGWSKIYRCADCSQPAFKYCGGSGGCNVFGCNCECRQPVSGRTCSYTCCDRSDRKARDVDEVGLEFSSAPLVANYTGYDVLKYVDTNKDGRLDEIEVKIFVTRHGLPDDDSWRSLDVDGDNHLSAHEIDDKLVPAPIFPAV